MINGLIPLVLFARLNDIYRYRQKCVSHFNVFHMTERFLLIKLCVPPLDLTSSHTNLFAFIRQMNHSFIYPSAQTADMGMCFMRYKSHAFIIIIILICDAILQSIKVSAPRYSSSILLFYSNGKILLLMSFKNQATKR